jgi:PAS domain S-box-containing protein
MKMTNAAPVEGTVIVNRLGTVEDADDGACALLGYSKRELVGLHGSELIPPAAQPATAVSIDRMRLGEISLQQQGRVRRKDGLVLSVDVSAQMLPNDRLAFRLRERPV